MNKTELIAKMSEKADITKADATKAVEAFIDSVSDALLDDDKLTLVGFGTFKMVKREAREGRNPATGEVIKIKATKVPKFVPGKGLKDLVNG